MVSSHEGFNRGYLNARARVGVPALALSHEGLRPVVPKCSRHVSNCCKASEPASFAIWRRIADSLVSYCCKACKTTTVGSKAHEDDFLLGFVLSQCLGRLVMHPIPSPRFADLLVVTSGLRAWACKARPKIDTICDAYPFVVRDVNLLVANAVPLLLPASQFVAANHHLAQIAAGNNAHEVLGDIDEHEWERICAAVNEAQRFLHESAKVGYNPAGLLLVLPWAA